jgi:hypothetical protein
MASNISNYESEKNWDESEADWEVIGWITIPRNKINELCIIGPPDKYHSYTLINRPVFYNYLKIEYKKLFNNRNFCDIQVHGKKNILQIYF